MNWFKKILAQRFFGDKEKMTYLDIGHDEGYTHPDNILWVYRGGSILTEIETDQHPNHESAFNIPPKLLDILYKGRYEKDTGRISIAKPKEGILANRDIPGSLINSLYKTFPNITEDYRF